VDLRFREEAVQVFELLAAEAQVAVVPERSPSICDAGVLAAQASMKSPMGSRPLTTASSSNTRSTGSRQHHELASNASAIRSCAPRSYKQNGVLAVQGIGRRAGEERGVVVEAADPPGRCARRRALGCGRRLSHEELVL
jgi:hypothetical protein